jgi:hypothetical protein
MKTLTVNVYELSELSEKSRAKAIAEHWLFLSETEYTTDTPEDIEYRNNLTEQDVIESIEINEYMFFENGDLISNQDYKNLK